MIALRPRGSTLILAMIMLAVLSVVGVAAVSLSAQERANAGAQVSYQALQRCAQAAQAKLWADAAVLGLNYFAAGNTLIVTSITLPDGRQLWAPAHYGTAAGTPVTQGMSQLCAGSSDAVSGEVDFTNKLGAGGKTPCAGGSTAATSVVARCLITGGDGITREHEVEVGFRFAL